MNTKRLRRHMPAAVLMALAATVSGLTGAAGAANAATAKAAIVPYPKALANHPFAEQWTGKQLTAKQWETFSSADAPGGCPQNPAQISVNSSGYAVLSTSGKENNCVGIQSPHTYPTVDGYVYEADIYFSTWENWSAFWMYGTDWPEDGEIDAVEANLDNNYVTWHYGTNNSTIGTGSWNGKVVKPTSANIKPGWHIVDIAFGGNRIQIFYDGKAYVSLPETLTATHDDPMWITVGTGSCEIGSNNECLNGTLGVDPPVAGTVQVKYLRAFLPPKK